MNTSIENVLQSKLSTNYKNCFYKIAQLKNNKSFSELYKNNQMFDIVQKTKFLNFNIISDYRNNRFSRTSL